MIQNFSFEFTVLYNLINVYSPITTKYIVSHFNAANEPANTIEMLKETIYQ